MSTYQLGTDAGGVGGMKDMVTITGVDPQPTEFLEYTEVTGQTLSGRNVESGLPKVTWNWGMLTQDSFDRLLTYCTGANADVFIRTRTNPGSPYTFANYRAIMQRPKAKTAPGNLRQDVQVIFVNVRSP